MKHIMVLMAFLLIFGCTSVENSSEGERDLELGIYTENEIKGYEEKIGREFDNVLQFHKIDNIDCEKIVRWAERGYTPIVTLEFWGTNYSSILDGKYDDQIKSLAKCSSGHNIYFRPLHEFNGDWYPWGALNPKNNLSLFVPTWKHVVEVFRSENKDAVVQLNYNRYNGKHSTFPFSTLYPGDEYVDMVTITTYNRCGTTKTHNYSSFEEDFDSAYRQVKSMTDKPIGIAEMSTSTLCNPEDKADWVYNSLETIYYEYPDVNWITWFAYNRPVGDIVWDWDLNTEEELNTFGRGVSLWRGTDE